MIELYRDGMVDAGFTQLSHLERLAQLRNRRRAWAHLEWKTSSVVRLRGICNAYELVGGIFAHGDTSGAEFVTTAFHSSTSPGHHQLRRENIQIHPKDFAIDPGQDLVIFIDTHENPVSDEHGEVFRLHVHSLSTQEKHPKARKPVLPIVVPPSLTYATFVRGITLQVADDIVAVMLYASHQQLVIFNWRDGTLITDSAERGNVLDMEADFYFISPRAFLLTSPEGNGSIHIYSFESVEGFNPDRVATLHLPALDADARYQTISPHSGPFETPSANTPFATSPLSRIYVITLSVLYDRTRLGIESQSELFYLFVKGSTFLSYVKAFLSGDSPAAVSVPWSQWGPSKTRLLAGLPSYSTWLRYVHGQRVVLPQKRGCSGAPVVRVLDFNVRFPLNEEYDTGSSEICTTPTQVRHCFQETVTTTLPYYTGSCTLSGLSDEYFAYMIDEERIIGIKESGDFDEEIQELHVFTF